MKNRIRVERAELRMTQQQLAEKHSFPTRRSSDLLFRKPVETIFQLEESE